MPGPLRKIDLQAAPGSWTFASAPPAADLTGAVVEYWEVKGLLSPFREKVLPNGCVEMMFNLGPPHRLLTDNESSVWEGAWLSGLHEHAIAIESLEGTHLVSARLHPVGALAFLGGALPRAANRVVDLGEVVGSQAADELRQQLLHAVSAETRFHLLEEFLRARCSLSDPASRLVRESVQRVEAAHGNLKISALHAELGVSRKHLATLFTREIGLTPKAFAGIQRFVWTLARIRESETVDWAQLAMDAGYSDQSHLARDFRRVAAASPTEFLRVRDPESTALLYEAR